MISSKLMRGKARILALPLLFTGLTACTTLGPDYTSPAPVPLPETWTAEDLGEKSADEAAWWKLFNDPVLDQLIDRGAGQNLSLEAAGLRIVQARAALGISDALVFPQQQQVSGNLAKLYQNETSFNSAGIGLDVGWEMDIWGKYARGIESAEANLYASIASYRDVLVIYNSRDSPQLHQLSYCRGAHLPVAAKYCHTRTCGGDDPGSI